MPATVEAEALARIKAKAEALTEAALKAGGSHYLLSELGLALGEDLTSAKGLTASGKLVDFVRDHLTEKFALVLVGKHNNIFALLPHSAVPEALEDQHASATPHVLPSSVVRKQGPRYHYRFWAAFSVPLKEGCRYLNLITLTFEDRHDNDEAVGPDTIPIKAELIAPEDASDRDALIASNITQWLTLNKLQANSFS